MADRTPWIASFAEKSSSTNGILEKSNSFNHISWLIAAALMVVFTKKKKQIDVFVNRQHGCVCHTSGQDHIGWFVRPWPLLVFLFSFCCCPAWLDCRPPLTSASLLWSFLLDFLSQCPIPAFLPQVTTPWCKRSPWEPRWMSQWHQRWKISSLFLRLVRGKEKKNTLSNSTIGPVWIRLWARPMTEAAVQWRLRSWSNLMPPPAPWETSRCIKRARTWRQDRQRPTESSSEVGRTTAAGDQDLGERTATKNKPRNFL